MLANEIRKERIINGERITLGEQLSKPGDFYYTTPQKWCPDGAIVMVCLVCKTSGGYPLKYRNVPDKLIKKLYRLINFKGEPLTVDGPLVCPYCKSQFTAYHGELEVIRN